MNYLRIALESDKNKPLAVIVKGNPKYLEDPKVSSLAKKFYAEIAAILRDKGYRVAFDAGEPFTQPDESAAVWVGHSRGIDRLRFAPRGVKCIELTTNDTHHVHGDNDRTGTDPQHYQLSEKDRRALQSLRSYS